MSTLLSKPTHVSPDTARRTVARSRVPMWRTLHQLLTEGNSALRDDFIRFVLADEEHLDEATRRLIHQLGNRLVQALTELAQTFGAPWAESEVALTAERMRGPEAWNVAVCFGWQQLRGSPPLLNQLTASHPIIILQHVPGSSGEQLRLQSGVVVEAPDPPQMNPRGQYTEEQPRPHLLRTSKVASVPTVRPCQAWIQAVLGLPPPPVKAPQRFLQAGATIAPALDLGRFSQYLLATLHQFLSLDRDDSSFTAKVLPLLHEAANLLSEQLPLCIEGAYELSVDFPNSAPEEVENGWLFQPEVSANVPNVGPIVGQAGLFVGEQSVRKIHMALCTILRGTTPPSAYQAPASFAPLASGHNDLPDLAELPALVLEELARASLRVANLRESSGEPSIHQLQGLLQGEGNQPFATIDARARLGRVAHHLATVGIPRGLANLRFAQPGTNDSIPGVSPTVALDGDFILELSPHLTVGLDLPYRNDASGNPQLLAKSLLTMRMASSWEDLTEAFLFGLDTLHIIRTELHLN